MEFENPSLLSLDFTEKDRLIVTFVDEVFFSRADQPIGIAAGKEVELELSPLLTEEEKETLVKTQEVISKTSQSIVLT